jgi:hypothetical protein
MEDAEKDLWIYLYYFQRWESKSKIRQFLWCVSPQIANPQIFMINPHIADPHIFTKHCPPLSQYSRKSCYLKQIFLLRTNMNMNIFFCNCAHWGLVSCKSTYNKNYLVRKSQIRKVYVCGRQIHERTISLRFLGIIFKITRLEVSVYTGSKNSASDLDSYLRTAYS